jgi:hypothetical protein
MALPFCTTCFIPSSLATIQSTSTALPGMPAPRSSGLGAILVHSTKPSGAGSPDATPSVNGFDANAGWLHTERENKPLPAVSSAPAPRLRNKRRRFMMVNSSMLSRRGTQWAMACSKSLVGSRSVSCNDVNCITQVEPPSPANL